MRRKKLLSLLVLLIAAVTGTRAEIIDLATSPQSPIMAVNGDVLTGTLADNNFVLIAPGATVTLAGVSINADYSMSNEYPGIQCEGDATIILKDGTTNIVKGLASFYPGIYVIPEHTLTIKGTGKLEAYSGMKDEEGEILEMAAGIGGSSDLSCGNIVILGGNILALGGSTQPGIGAGAGCGDITIAGTVDKVTAVKGAEADVCIGTNAENQDCGTITIAPSLADATYAGTRVINASYDVTFAEGTADADNWSASPNPAGNGEEVTLTYKGKKKVKAVILETAPDPVLVTGIILNKTELELSVDGTETLRVAGVLPDNATDNTYTWSSADNSIATVDAETGVVSAVAPGTTYIWATANDNSGVATWCKVTVKAAAAPTTKYKITASVSSGEEKDVITIDELPYETTLKELITTLGYGSYANMISGCTLSSGESIEIGDFDSSTHDCTLKAIKTGSSQAAVSAMFTTLNVTITVTEVTE